MPDQPPLTESNEIPTYMDLDDCIAWEQFTTLLPSAVSPGKAPSGWEPTDPGLALAGGLGVKAFECQHVAVGPLERGPVRILLDTHWNIDIPEPCKQDAVAEAFRSYGIVTLALIDDAELAAYLNQTLSMPAKFGEFAATETQLGDAKIHQWSWRLPGGTFSNATLLEDGTHQDRLNMHRYYWPWGTKLVRMQLDVTEDGPFYANRDGKGEYAEPMLMSHLPGGSFAGISDWFSATPGTTTFKLYNDHLCLEPV